MQSEVRWKNASFGFFGIPKSPFVLLTVIARVLVAGCREYRLAIHERLRWRAYTDGTGDCEYRVESVQD